MTIKTKPSVEPKKPELIEGRNLDDDELVEGRSIQEWVGPKKPGIMVMVLVVTVGLVGCSLSGYLIYCQFGTCHPTRHYKKVCPRLEDNSEGNTLETTFHDILEPWGSDADVQVVDITNAPFLTENQGSLHEQLKISDNMTMIILQDNNKPPVTVFHDFDANVTTIKDSDRCFIMSLDPEVVLPPLQLFRALARGAALDQSHVHTVLEVVLPALPPGTAARCSPSAPAYALRETRSNLFKRSLSPSEPSYHYAVFSGRGVQTLSLTNMPRVRRVERAQRAAH